MVTASQDIGTRLAFRSDVQGIRGLAILLVVAYHAGVPGISGGYIGVDVFFILSGYLITGLLLQEARATGDVSLIEFYARRARRLLPAAFFVVLVTIAIGRVLLAPLEQRIYANTALATILYISNFWFIRQSSDYFAAEASSNPLLHTWSLAVEEQFYFVWPILLVTVLTHWRKGTPGWRLALTMGGLAAISFASSLWLTHTAQHWAFFSSPTRAWEFCVGGLAYLVSPRGNLRTPLSQYFGALGLAVIAGSAVVLNDSTAFPGVAAAFPVLGTVLLLISGGAGKHQIAAGVSRLLIHPVMQWLGRLSYSWYLWHWPVLVYAEVVTGRTSLWARLCFVIAALGLSALTYTFLENPIRGSRALAPRAATTVALGLLLSVGAAGVAVWWRVTATTDAASPAQQQFVRAKAELPRVYADGCHAWHTDIALPDCEYGMAEAEVTVVLLGDSHAAQWFPPLEQIALQRGMKLVSWTKSECPYPLVTIYSTQLGREYSECDAWRSDTLKRIRTMAPAVVILASANRYAFAQSAPMRPTLKDWEAGTRALVAALVDAGVRVAFMRDNPRPGFDVPACLARAEWNPWNIPDACTFPRDEEVNSNAFAIEERMAAEFEGVFTIDLYHEICPSPQCDSVRNGIVLYQDSNHITTEYSRHLEPLIGHMLEKILPASPP